MDVNSESDSKIMIIVSLKHKLTLIMVNFRSTNVVSHMEIHKAMDDLGNPSAP